MTSSQMSSARPIIPFSRPYHFLLDENGVLQKKQMHSLFVLPSQSHPFCSLYHNPPDSVPFFSRHLPGRTIPVISSPYDNTLFTVINIEQNHSKINKKHKFYVYSIILIDILFLNEHKYFQLTGAASFFLKNFCFVPEKFLTAELCFKYKNRGAKKDSLLHIPVLFILLRRFYRSAQNPHCRLKGRIRRGPPCGNGPGPAGRRPASWQSSVPPGSSR